MPSLSARDYSFVFAGIVAIVGVATYFLSAAPTLPGVHFVLEEPAEPIEAVDEFIPLSFTFTPPSSRFGAFVDGNFWLLLKTTDPAAVGQRAEPMMAPFYPREVPKLFTNDATNAVRFGDHDFTMNHTHAFSGYAYISPSDVFDGQYEAQVIFMRTEEGKSPQQLSQSNPFTISVKRMFNLQHSLIVAQQPTEIKKVGNEWALMTLNVRAIKDDITVRALELGAPSVRRVSDAVTTLSLYDMATGEKVSTLTDTKVSALTLERYTVYVLDTPFVANSQFTRTFELRATVDESLLHTDRSILFALVRMYGINIENQKTAESISDVGVRISLPHQ